jgi:hypothetical protein
MAERPSTLPTWRFWPDGRARIVHTLDEWDALEPGHADSRAGPFPAVPEAPAPADRRPGPTREQPSEWQRIRDLQAEGMSQQAMAETLGISRARVRRLLEEEAP